MRFPNFKDFASPEALDKVKAFFEAAGLNVESIESGIYNRATIFIDGERISLLTDSRAKLVLLESSSYYDRRRGSMTKGKEYKPTEMVKVKEKMLERVKESRFQKEQMAKAEQKQETLKKIYKLLEPAFNRIRQQYENQFNLLPSTYQSKNLIEVYVKRPGEVTYSSTLGKVSLYISEGKLSNVHYEIENVPPTAYRDPKEAVERAQQYIEFVGELETLGNLLAEETNKVVEDQTVTI